ncbi:SDR family NAD(P)-dependent oxidoreductase [Methylobrevis pamukkalensis]|uniref:D-beta-hydroxybutyrate dehydrogenase n=1 Tax=Methylobrevis pamukkalensis TaxID=1439726 RepID=A0A1E3H8H9_9HYPH|nr:SDR family NAD(P)-dependent oxidoreductase [Methylobrevis pamukkalensis]ODN72637.1 D-beta-hydroxybutyrate dehydrogenase [Methylobrevis pamukkalensis]
MSGSTEQRVILITGASSGIGLAAAQTMAQRGWRVFATARKPEDLAMLGAIEGVTAVYLDYAEPASIAACADKVLAATGGRIDALFNNGAYGQPGAVEDLRPDVLRAQFEVNVFGWHDLTCRLIPAMRARRFGRIVQCSSILGFIALKYRGAYIASKHAVEGLTDTLRLEVKGAGIDVSSIRPGPIATRFVETSMRMFHANIDIDGSRHAKTYRDRLARMGRGGAARFKLGPEAVVAKLIHAVESDRPKPYYAVTTPTVVMGLLKRLLPSGLFVSVCRKVSNKEEG